MAIAATTVWEVRPDGSLNNGGGFNPARGGVDYSQQAAPVLALSDVVGTSTTTLTSATGGFTAPMIGNILNVPGIGLFEITVINSATSITVDRATGTFAARAANVGGAMTIDGDGFEPIGQGGLALGEKMWVRGTNAAGAAVTYTPGVAPNLTVSGSKSNYVTVEGYSTVRGDGGIATISYSGGIAMNANYNILRNIQIQGITGLGVALTVAGSNCFVENVIGVPTASTQGTGIVINGAATTLRRCWVQASPAAGGPSLTVNAVGCTIEYSRFDGGTSGGGATDAVWLGSSSGPTLFRGCVFRNGGLAGVKGNNNTYNAQFLGCVFWNCGTDGLNIVNSGGGLAASLLVENCVFGKNVNYDVDYSTEDASAFPGAQELVNSVFRCNWFYTTGLGRYHQLPANPNDSVLTVDPFTNSAGGDFTLNNLTGGGALIRATACTVAWPDGLNASTVYGGPYGTPPPSAPTQSLRSLWRELTNERDSVTIPDTTVDLYINRGLEALNRLIRYHWKTDSTSIALVAGTQEYTLPLDLVEVQWVEWGGKELDKGDIDQWRRGTDPWRTESDGSLREWAHYGQTIVFRPIPSAACVAKQASPIVRCVNKPEDFATSGPLQLSQQDWPIPVYYGAALWSICHPESALSASRAQDLMNLFLQEADRVKKDYADKGVQK